MARWAYAGPGPHDDGNGGLIRPGDVREDPLPEWGPWLSLDDAETAQDDSGVQSPAPAPENPPETATEPSVTDPAEGN